MANVSLLKNANPSKPISSPTTVGGTVQNVPGGRPPDVDYGGSGGGGMLYLLAKLREMKEAKDIQNQQRIENIRRLQNEELKAADEKTAGVFKEDVAARFGKADEAEIAPYTAPAKRLLDRGAQVDAPVGSMFGTPNVAGGGNMLRRPATVQDARQALDTGAEQMRKDSKAAVSRLPETVDREGIAREVEESPTPVAPARLSALSKEREALMQQGMDTTAKATNVREYVQTSPDRVRKSKADTRTAEATATEKEVEAKYAEPKAAVGLRKTTAEATKAETDAAYAPYLNASNLRIKQLEEQLKTIDLKMKPLEAEKLRIEVENTKLQNQKLLTDAQNSQKINALRDMYMREPDPRKRTQILKNLAVQNGHEATVITDESGVGPKYAAITKSAQEMRLSALEAIENNDPASAQSALDAYNNLNMQAAQLVGSGTMTIMTARPVEGVIYGSSLQMGSKTVPIDVATAYSDGTLDSAIQGQIPGVDPGWALSQKVTISHAYGVGNPTVFENAIRESGAAPEVQTRALELLNAAQPQTPKSPTEKKESQEGPSETPANAEKRGQIRSRLKSKGQDEAFRNEVAPSFRTGGLRAARPSLTDEKQIQVYIEARKGGASQPDALRIARGQNNGS